MTAHADDLQARHPQSVFDRGRRFPPAHDVHGKRTGPSVWTSASSSIPRSRARAGDPRPSGRPRRPSSPRRCSRRSSRAWARSWLRRSSAPAAPTPASRSPAVSPGGFLNVEPNVRMPFGWAACRRSRSAASRALTSSLGAGASANSARATISPATEVRGPVGQPSASGSRRSTPPAAWTSTQASTRRARRRRRWRSSARPRRPCPGCSPPNSIPRARGRPPGPRPPAAARRPRSGGRARRGSIRASSRSSLSTSPRHALVGDEQVRPRPDHVDLAAPAAAAQASSSSSSRRASRARVELGRAPGADRRQPRRAGTRATGSEIIADQSPPERVDVAGPQHEQSVPRGAAGPRGPLGRAPVRAASRPVGRRRRRRSPRRSSGR